MVTKNPAGSGSGYLHMVLAEWDAVSVGNLKYEYVCGFGGIKYDNIVGFENGRHRPFWRKEIGTHVPIWRKEKEIGPYGPI